MTNYSVAKYYGILLENDLATLLVSPFRRFVTTNMVAISCIILYATEALVAVFQPLLSTFTFSCTSWTVNSLACNSVIIVFHDVHQSLCTKKM